MGEKIHEGYMRKKQNTWLFVFIRQETRAGKENREEGREKDVMRMG